MRLAVDTNVLLDAILEREGFEDAQALIMKIAQDKAEGVISANSITDVYYILRKRIGDGKAREAIWNLMAVFDVAEVSGEICAEALGSAMKDYEDAVLALCAEKAGADRIITRDQEFIKETASPIGVTTVEAALAELS